MTASRPKAISSIAPQLTQFLQRHILGLKPDPETWPAPSDIDALPIPDAISHNDAAGAATILATEKTTTWPKRRTSIGAQAYRLIHNGEYDCGWRLVDLAYRFLSEQYADDKPEIVTILPPPPVTASVPALNWCTKRLAERLDALYLPNLFDPVAPIGRHPDLTSKLPTIPAEFYNMASTVRLTGKVILLCDWRWHQGRMITMLARQLAKAGAAPIRFTWLD
jgi:hypothetical protein